MKNESLFELLRHRSIIDILDGDTQFESFSLSDDIYYSIAMPYLSGPKICDISKLFGLPIRYDGRSRWMYLDELIQNCIKSNSISKLLSHLFSLEQFRKYLFDCPRENIEIVHRKIVEKIINNINKVLFFGKNELVVFGNNFVIKPIGADVSVNTPNVKTIDRAYISDLAVRAKEDIDSGNFDSAITKARTLLEEVFCYVIERKGETPTDSGDIGKLYNQVKTLYNMHQNKEMDKRINMCLSGLEKILTSITLMRNEVSDAHGVGNRRLTIAEHHTWLFINSAMTMADFILSVSFYNRNAN